MATATPAEKTTAPKGGDSRAPQKGLVPPDENLWKRYSPHGEGPLSGITSITLHVLVVGIAAFWAFYLIYAFGFAKPNQSLPIEPVRFAEGGGGGSKHGVGDKNGVGEGPLKEGTDPDASPGDTPDANRPALTPVEQKQVEQNFDQSDARYLSKGPPSTAAFVKLDDDARKMMRDGLNPGKGAGGTGKGGGDGTGDGTGNGTGQGPGTAKLTEREKRMLRWSMQFTTNDSADYLAQLRDLRAILAVPVGPKGEYKTIHDLSKRPAELQDEDLSKIERIWWIDDKPQNVRGLLEAMGLPGTPTPPRIVAFIPRELEDELADKEKKAARGLTEDKIYETKFRVDRHNGKYEVVVVGVTPKR